MENSNNTIKGKTDEELLKELQSKPLTALSNAELTQLEALMKRQKKVKQEYEKFLIEEQRKATKERKQKEKKLGKLQQEEQPLKRPRGSPMKAPVAIYQLPKIEKLLAIALEIGILVGIFSITIYLLNKLLQGIVPYGSFSHWYDWINSFDLMDQIAIYGAILFCGFLFFIAIVYLEYHIYQKFYPNKVKPNLIQIKELPDGTVQYIEVTENKKTVGKI